MMLQKIISVTAPARGLFEITSRIREVVSEADTRIGLCHIYIHHTSASLTICENYDPLVLSDLENFMLRLIKDGDPLFQHVSEGPDDMPSHIRSILTQTFLTLPITQNRLGLGKWQGIFLWEHRLQPPERHITVTLSV